MRPGNFCYAICTALIIHGSCWCARADIGGTLAELYGAVKEEASSKGSIFSKDTAQQASLYQHMNQVRANVLADNPNVEESIRALRGFSTSDKVHKLCDSLLAEALKSHEDNEAAFVKDVEEAIKRAGDAVLKAKVESDLGPTLSELSHLAHTRSPSPFVSTSSLLRSRAAQKLTDTINFVMQWQDYLTAHRLGNDDLANSKLRNLANNALIVSRSDIVALIKPVESKATPASPRGESNDMSEIVSKVQKLDDIPAALERIESLKRTNSGAINYEVVGALTSMASAHEAFKNGLPMEISVHNFSPTARIRFPQLANELLLLMMPRYFGNPERTAKPGETVQIFVDRTVNEAKSEKNWPLLLQAMELTRFLNGSGFPSNDTTPLRAFVIAQNQETAGQYAPAVVSYQASLRDTTGMVPIALVGERLKTIKTNHPKEYSEGMQAAQGMSGRTARYSEPSSLRQFANADPDTLAVPAQPPVVRKRRPVE